MRGAVQMQITTIGLDIAKNVFQVHGIDAAEKAALRTGSIPGANERH
jgi:transposase